MRHLFTIGHSNHTWEHFLALLKKHDVQAVADVRSSPYSARLPHFSREVLEKALGAAGIRYVFLGGELGARRCERECYVDRVARYDLIAKTTAFAKGLERLLNGSQRLRIALFCAEKDPLECHRTVLVCRHLKDSTQIDHILADGSLEPHSIAEKRLMTEEGIPGEDFFTSPDMLLAQAYEKRGGKIAYREGTEDAASA